jgi:hypothetical protein
MALAEPLTNASLRNLFKRLKGSHPGGPCLYRRVLVSAQVHGTVLPAWLYVGEDPISGRLTPLGGSRLS